MTRRRLVVLSSAAVLLVLGLAVVGAVVGVTQTSFGREWVRGQLVALAKRANGRIYIGRLGGNLFTGVTVDSLEIRGPDDSVFVRTGPIAVAYDPRDLFDRRIVVRSLDVQRPYVHLKKLPDDRWNWRVIFPSSDKPKSNTGPGFGDYVMLRNARLHGGALTLTLAWHPDDSLGGARRDSAIRFNLSRPDHDIRREGNRFVRSWHWTGGEYAADSIRLNDPARAGRYFDVASLAVNESDPPFRFRNVRGGFLILGDTLTLRLAHWDAPASTGTAAGRVVWGSDLPIRYDLDVRGDSVALNDVAWVYETLPTTGGGRMRLRIRNEPSNLNVIDYALSGLDVRSTRSRVEGAMTFGVGGPVLVVKDVALRGAPLDFALVRALNGKPFPYDWQGQITGTVHGPGGRLDRFLVDSSRIAFADAHVPGAITRATGRGELDILRPAFTSFRGFAVDVSQLDLRTIEFLNPNFPRLGGYVAGRTVLDSSWLDVRFRDADVRHVDGPGEPSHFTGRGRVTWGQFLTYDLDLQADPISLTTLARSYPKLTLRGPLRGPLRVAGTVEALDVATTLAGPAGTFALNGRLDAYEPTYGLTGTGTFAGLDFARLTSTDPATIAGATPTELTGSFDADVSGSAPEDLTGSLALTLQRSTLGKLRIRDGLARMRFGHGAASLDTLALESPAGRLSAAGGLGLVAGTRDSVRFSLAADSLGGLRPYLASVAPEDTLAGRLRLDGVVTGSIDTVSARGTISAGDVVVGQSRAARVRGTFAFTDLAPPAGDSSRGTHGALAVTADTVRAASLDLRTVLASASVGGTSASPVTRLSFDALESNGPRLRAAAEASRRGDTSLVRLDSVVLDVRDDRWRLRRPATIASSSAGVVVDTILLDGARGARIRAGGTLPATAPVRLFAAADSVPLAELSVLAQLPLTLGGVASIHATADGLRERPSLRFEAAAADATASQVRVERLTVSGRYDDQRLTTGLRLYRAGRPALSADADLPLDLALIPVTQRRLAGPLRANVRTDSVDLAVLEAFSENLRRARGRFEANVDVGGTWEQPSLSGRVSVANGDITVTSLGTRFQRVVADIALAGDSLAIRTLSVATPGRRTGSASLAGYVTFARLADPHFDLTFRARDFHAIANRRVADLEISTGGAGLHLTGATDASRVTGTVEVARGDIAIPELSQKKVVALDDAEFAQVVDTSLSTNRRLLPNAPPALVQNLRVDNVRVSMGSDVWLRSSEASINLGGSLLVTSGRADDAATGESRTQLALDGELRAERGTYRLALAPGLQRTFDVERGTLRFYGSDADINPALDISALHTIRTFSQAQRDVRIRVLIGGTLAQPSLSLASADNLQLSQSDLFSYLVTGAPSNGIAGLGDEGRTSIDVATAVLLPSLGSYLSARLNNFADVIEVQAGTLGDHRYDNPGSAPTGVGGVLSSTRLGAGWQIADRHYLSTTLGLCSLGGQLGTLNFSTFNAQSLASDLRNTYGLRYEYRIKPGVTASLSREPGTTGLLCDPRGSVRTFVPSPAQFGLDLLKKWEF